MASLILTSLPKLKRYRILQRDELPALIHLEILDILRTGIHIMYHELKAQVN